MRTRRPAARRAARARRPARLPRAAARVRALVAGQDARALHGDDRGGHPALAARQGPRLDDGRVLAAARLDRRAHAARRHARAPGRAHGRDPAADRSRAARRLRLRGARRAHALARLRRAAGRRRHALRRDHGRVRGRLSRARPDGPLEGAAARRSPPSRSASSTGVAVLDLDYPEDSAGRDGHERRDDRRRSARRGAGDGRARAVHAGRARRAARPRRGRHRGARVRPAGGVPTLRAREGACSPPGNPHKLDELRRALPGWEIELVDDQAFPPRPGRRTRRTPAARPCTGAPAHPTTRG